MILQFIFHCICMPVFANDYKNFVLDYFQYKEVSSVVGYTCNGAEDDLFLIKSLSNIGVPTSLSKSNDYQVHRFAHTEYWKLGVLVDLRCYDAENVTSIFSVATEYRMYDDLHHWLILGSSIEDVISIVDDNAFGLATEFAIAVPITDLENTYYRLYDVYNAWKERGASLIITFMGSWTENNRLIISIKEAKYKRRSNLFGMTVRASFFYSQYKPQNMTLEDYLQDYSSTTKDGLSKFGFIVITYLSEMFNFTLKAGVVAKWEVGDSIGPIIRALANKEIDITGSPASMNAKRTYLVKYIHQSWPFRSCFIFRNPQRKNIKINEILGPLEMNVWHLMTVFFILSVFTMTWLLKFENFEGFMRRFSDSLVIVVGAICQQSTDIPMNHVSTRIALLYIMIFSLLVYNYYSASIVSARLNEPIIKINDSLSEMSKLKLKFSSEWMVYFELFIKRPDWETQTFYNNHWRRIPEAEQFMLPEKAMRLVKDGGFAYHAHPDISYPFINQFYSNREICELTEVHLAKPTYSTFAVSLNSTFTEIMKTGIMKMSEVGIRHRQVLRWTTRKPQCHKNILTASSIDIYEFAPHLLILIFGMMLAAAICCIEIIIERSTSSNVKRLIIAATIAVKKYR